MTMLTRLVLLILVFVSSCDTRDIDRTATQLADLNITVGQLDPAFSSSTRDYTASVASDVDSVTVVVTSTHQDATITINDVPVDSNAGSTDIQLNEGGNTITILVMAADQVRTRA